MREKLAEIVATLILLKQEGGFWDFKREWHDNKADLLHDIICLANNLEDKDGYLILGVEDKTYRLFDVSNDVNRKNTQNLVDFLKDKAFAGGVRPIVIVETIMYESVTLDVLIVKNTTKTPYYLTKKYEGVFANQIYTRVQDVNTPKNMNADIDKIEYLWKKRFGIEETPLNRFYKYLLDFENWVEQYTEDQGESYYYKYFPEFNIKILRDEDKCETEPYALVQCDQSMSNSALRFQYFGTVLEMYWVVNLDGARGRMVTPNREFIDYENGLPNNKEMYRYRVVDSKEDTLQKWLNCRGTSEQKSVLRRTNETVIIFESEEQKFLFDNYVLGKKEEINKRIRKKVKEKTYNYLFVPTYLNKDAVLRELYFELTIVEIFKEWQDCLMQI